MTGIGKERCIEFFDRVAKVDAFGARFDRTVAEVLAGAETAARAGQHQHPHAGVKLHSVEGGPHFKVHRLREAIELVRAVQRQQRDTILDLELDVFVVHAVSVVIIYSAWSKSTTTLSVTGKLWQDSTKPRAIS
jgi:hypothetical protein